MAEIFIPSLQDFITLGKTVGFARTDKFVVNFKRPEGLNTTGNIPQILSMVCEEASFPGKTIGTRDLRINALTEKRAQAIDYGGTIGFTFVTDYDFTARNFFDAWQRLCVNDATREVSFYRDYISTITVAALFPINNPDTPQDSVPVWSIEIHEAWPIRVEPQQFSHSQQQFLRLNVEFAFKYWTKN